MGSVDQLTILERKALHRAIDSVESQRSKRALLQQVDALRVTCRSDKTTGYYVDFAIPEQLLVEDLPDDFNNTPPQAEAQHPDGVNAIHFVVYVKDGMLSYMELASTSD